MAKRVGVALNDVKKPRTERDRAVCGDNRSFGPAFQDRGSGHLAPFPPANSRSPVIRRTLPIVAPSYRRLTDLC